MTCMPASRRARATTLTPRSWPSRPTLARTTRIGAGVDMAGRSPERGRASPFILCRRPERSALLLRRLLQLPQLAIHLAQFALDGVEPALDGPHRPVAFVAVGLQSAEPVSVVVTLAKIPIAAVGAFLLEATDGLLLRE